MLIEYYQKDKIVINGSSSRSYGDISLIGRKSVCSMDNANNNTNNTESSSNNSNGSSGRSTPCSFREYPSRYLSETENLNNSIGDLQRRIQQHNQLIRLLNDSEIRAIAIRSDRNITLTDWER
jgi:hypothetical protein